jgi:hypothetical protein
MPSTSDFPELDIEHQEKQGPIFVLQFEANVRILIS